MKAYRVTDREYQSEAKHFTIKVKKIYTIADFLNEKKKHEILEYLNNFKIYNKESEEVKE